VISGSLRPGDGGPSRLGGAPSFRIEAVRPRGRVAAAVRAQLLRFDVVAGATIWGLLVPEVIAYAGLAGVPPQAGLYTLLVMPAAYALLGTSRHLVAAGTSAAAVLLASTVVALHPTGSSGYLTDAAALVLATGVLFVLAGSFGSGSSSSSSRSP
jgi:sulfate permease, SulP family